MVRPAGTGDVAGLAAILDANGEPMDWPDLPELGWPYLDHLVVRARVTVAEVDGSVAGFAGSVPVGRADIRFLTDLFVDPARHDRGAGRALVTAALEGSTERMTFSSTDERALALYLRAGMRPWWPLLYVEVPEGSLGAHEPGIAVAPADPEATARSSRQWTGVDRLPDFEHYASLPEAAGFIVRDGGAVAAIGWARRERKRSHGRWLDHASIAPDADPVRAALGVLRAAAGNERLTAGVPGPNRVMTPLLERGVRIVGRDQFCATDPSLVDLERLLPNPGFL